MNNSAVNHLLLLKQEDKHEMLMESKCAVGAGDSHPELSHLAVIPSLTRLYIDTLNSITSLKTNPIQRPYLCGVSYISDHFSTMQPLIQRQASIPDQAPFLDFTKPPLRTNCMHS
jgi:hypothetical protein